MVRVSFIIAGVTAGIYVIPPVRRRFDNKIFKHVRNYGATLGQYNKFNTQEEFYEMLSNVGNGVATFFSDWSQVWIIIIVLSMRSNIFYINIAYLQFNKTLHSISVEEAFILVGASDFFYLLGFGSSLAFKF